MLQERVSFKGIGNVSMEKEAGQLRDKPGLPAPEDSRAVNANGRRQNIVEGENEPQEPGLSLGVSSPSVFRTHTREDVCQ